MSGQALYTRSEDLSHGRSYQHYCTLTRQIQEVKRAQARPVVRWVTTCEALVTIVFHFLLSKQLPITFITFHASTLSSIIALFTCFPSLLPSLLSISITHTSYTQTLHSFTRLDAYFFIFYIGYCVLLKYLLLFIISYCNLPLSAITSILSSSDSPSSLSSSYHCLKSRYSLQ